MKNFTFTDLNGKKHTYRPSDFSASRYIDGIFVSYPFPQSVRPALEEYAKKAYAYMAARQSKRQAQKKAYRELFEKISFLCSCGFPNTPIYEVLDAFGNAHALRPVYRHHAAFHRGYVGVDERKKPIFWFYFGTFGGGFEYYEFFSTRYCYRHLILLSSWWFANGDWRNGISQTALSLFERFCKYGELPIGS